MNIAERTVVLCGEPYISATFLKGLLSNETPIFSNSTSVSDKKKDAKRPKIKREDVERLLEIHSQQRVCEMLGISRTTLWRIKNKGELHPAQGSEPK